MEILSYFHSISSYHITTKFYIKSYGETTYPVVGWGTWRRVPWRSAARPGLGYGPQRLCPPWPLPHPPPYCNTQHKPTDYHSVYCTYFKKHENIFVFYIFSEHWDCAGSLNLPHVSQGFIYPVMQYHSWWCTGDTRREGISSHGTDHKIKIYSTLSHSTEPSYPGIFWFQHQKC